MGGWGGGDMLKGEDFFLLLGEVWIDFFSKELSF